jgi:membrane dipeptidase
MTTEDILNARIDRLHRHGLVDMHFDLLMDLFEKRSRQQVIQTDFLPDLQAGDIGVLGVAVYLTNQYVPEMALRVALDQIARLYIELDQLDRLVICRSYAEILRARQAGQIALLITLEGVEPLGGDPNLLRVFYELGVRSIGLTHLRRNQAGEGGLFAPSGSSPAGLTAFGREIIRQCESLGIIIDLAHLNPAGFDEVLALTQRPVIISHTNPRRFYDIERNSSDEQIKQVGQRGGVVGVGAILLSPDRNDIHLDHYVHQIEYVAKLAGIDGVGLGFDFFEFMIETLSKADMTGFPEAYFMPNFTTHAHTRHLTRKLIERGFSDEEIEKILYGNFMRIFKEWLK